VVAVSLKKKSAAVSVEDEVVDFEHLVKVSKVKGHTQYAERF